MLRLSRGFSASLDFFCALVALANEKAQIKDNNNKVTVE